MSTNADKSGSISADAYRRPGTVTGSNPSNFSQTAKPPALGGTMLNVDKLTQVYDPSAADGTNQTVKTGFVHTNPAPVAPNRMAYGRDPYKSAGMPTEPYLDNSAGPASIQQDTNGGPAYGVPPFVSVG